MEKKGRVENLIPCSQRSKEEARELGKKGGERSGVVRREKRDWRIKFAAAWEAKRKGSNVTAGDEVIDKVMDDLIKNGDIDKLQKAFEVLGLKEKDDKKPSTTTIVINEVVARNGG